MEDKQQEDTPPSRRDLLKVVTVGLCGVAAGVGVSATLPGLVQSPPGGWRFLNASEVALLEAVCEQIIPADQDPGAKETGAVVFIDRQLVGPYRRYQAKYRQGLASLQQTSRKQHNQDFQQLAWDVQTALLKSIEAGRTPKGVWSDPGPREFFSLVIEHTMQSYYGSPRHGGNRGYASFKMMGLEYPRVLGQNRYREPLVF